jgi:hypothetical protein
VTNAAAPTRNNRFSRCQFIAPATGGGEKAGYGVLIESNVPGGSNKSNSFYDCKFNDAYVDMDGNGASLLIQSTVGTAVCRGHSFINCRVDVPPNEDAGIILDGVEEVMFLNTTVDATGTAKQVQLKNCKDVYFFGAFDGFLTDDQPDPNAAAITSTQISAPAGRHPPLRVPYLNFRKIADQSRDGTLWYGQPQGDEGLFVTLNGGIRRRVQLTPAQ